MSDLNKCIFIGRLARDPELRYLPSQTSVCSFGLAVGRKYKVDGDEREETAFLDCTLFGKGGEIFNQYMAKGKQVCITARARMEQWDDKQTGQKRSKITFVVEDFQFLGSPNKPEGDGDERPGGYGKPARSGGGRVPSVPRQPGVSSPPAGPLDDIPF